MKHMMKRSLSMLLLLVMVLTVFPVMSSTAVAAEPQGNVDPAELYVTDGATLFLTPDGVDVEAGTWASRVGSLAATLKGGAYNAETNPTGWRTNGEGIPYYRLQNPSVFGEKRGKVGIVLPTEAISNGDFTFEALFKPLYLSGEDGVVVPSYRNQRSQRLGCVFLERPFRLLACGVAVHLLPSLHLRKRKLLHAAYVLPSLRLGA